MPDYDMPLWRPPSEGDNLIIQATLGCRFNRCTFCSMYKTKIYVERSLDAVRADIDRASRLWPQAHRVFLADGDAYGLPTATLLALAAHLRERFAALQRITAYATPFNLLSKGVDEIEELRRARLTLVYLGIESGSERLLRAVGKGSVRQMEAALARSRYGGLKVSATVILGLGGRAHGQEHIEATAELINRQPPKYLSTLHLMLAPEIASNFRAGFAERMGEAFEPADDRDMLAELHRLIECLNPPAPVIFRSNHASNALPLAGNLPRDRDRLLAEISDVMGGAMGGANRQLLRPRWLRSL
ncbi:MAG: radical SAM protein [Rhodospirillaceae bacterium]